MKKLLILMLVLAMASLASATVTVSVSSNEVAVGGTITISVSSDTTLDYVKYLDMVKGTATWGACTILPAAGTEAQVVDYTTTTNFDYELTAAQYSGNVTPGVHFTLVATATGIVDDTFTIELLSGNSPYGVEDSETVTIVPEPATMLILGLGSLLLRRRK